MNLRKMAAMIREFRAGAPLGDVALLKFDALSKSPEGMNERLGHLSGYAPRQDLESLRQLPDGTFGREYARFLEANGISPLVPSSAIIERFHDNPYVLRYATTHDLHPLLCGFDAGLAGEAGVFAFTVGQGSSPGGTGLLWTVRVLDPLVTPTQARQVWNNIRVGLELGRSAKLLIAEPRESRYGEPLESVRTSLGLAADPAMAGVVASGRSRVQEWVYGGRRALGT